MSWGILRLVPLKDGLGLLFIFGYWNSLVKPSGPGDLFFRAFYYKFSFCNGYGGIEADDFIDLWLLMVLHSFLFSVSFQRHAFSLFLNTRRSLLSTAALRGLSEGSHLSIRHLLIFFPCSCWDFPSFWPDKWFSFVSWQGWSRWCGILCLLSISYLSGRPPVPGRGTLCTASWGRGPGPSLRLPDTWAGGCLGAAR